MSAAAKRPTGDMEIYRMTEEVPEEDPAYTAATRVGEGSYLAIAQLMSFEPVCEKETLPPPSSSNSVVATSSGVRPAVRVHEEVKTAPPPAAEVAVAAAPIAIPSPPASLASGHGGFPLVAFPPPEVAPVAIHVLSSSPYAAPAPRRLVSIETIIFCFAFTLAAAPFVAYFLLFR